MQTTLAGCETRTTFAGCETRLCPELNLLFLTMELLFAVGKDKIIHKNPKAIDYDLYFRA